MSSLEQEKEAKLIEALLQIKQKYAIIRQDRFDNSTNALEKLRTRKPKRTQQRRRKPSQQSVCVRLPLYAPALPTPNAGTCELHNTLELFSLSGDCPIPSAKECGKPILNRSLCRPVENRSNEPRWPRGAAHVAIAFDVYYRFNGLRVDNKFLETQPNVDDFAVPMWRTARLYNSMSFEPPEAPSDASFRPYDAAFEEAARRKWIARKYLNLQSISAGAALLSPTALDRRARPGTAPFVRDAEEPGAADDAGPRTDGAGPRRPADKP